MLYSANHCGILTSNYNLKPLKSILAFTRNMHLGINRGTLESNRNCSVAFEPGKAVLIETIQIN